MVKQTKHADFQGEVITTGELAIVNGEVTAVGIDRNKDQ